MVDGGEVVGEDGGLPDERIERFVGAPVASSTNMTRTTSSFVAPWKSSSSVHRVSRTTVSGAPIAAQYIRRACLSSASASAGVRAASSWPSRSNFERRSGSLRSSYAAPIVLNVASARSFASGVSALSG